MVVILAKGEEDATGCADQSVIRATSYHTDLLPLQTCKHIHLYTTYIYLYTTYIHLYTCYIYLYTTYIYLYTTYIYL